MENKNLRVEQIKATCEDLDRKLQNKYVQLKAEGVSEEVLREIEKYDGRLHIIYDMVKDGRVSNSDLVAYENELYRMVGELSVKYGSEYTYTVLTPTNDENKNSNKGLLWKVGLAGVAGAAIGVGGTLLASHLVNESNEEVVEEVDDEVNAMTSSIDEYLGDNVAVIEQPVLGEYGTFTDITDQEQVHARAEFIYNRYFVPFVNQLDSSDSSYITVNRIENVIRVFGGQPPVDENGNIYMNGNVVNDAAQAFAYLVGTVGSSPQLDRVYDIPAYLFTTDGTELQEFLMLYDLDYAKMTYGLNLAREQRACGQEVTAGTLVREAIASYGEKLIGHWQNQGMYEGFTNPFNFQVKDRFLAFSTAAVKYGSYNFEYHLGSMQAVCIPACVDYSSKEMVELPVNDIYTAFLTSEWNKIIPKASGMENDVYFEPDSAGFARELMEEVTWNYNNNYKLVR